MPGSTVEDTSEAGFRRTTLLSFSSLFPRAERRLSHVSRWQEWFVVTQRRQLQGCLERLPLRRFNRRHGANDVQIGPKGLLPRASSSPGQTSSCQGHPYHLAKRLAARGILITWPKAPANIIIITGQKGPCQGHPLHWSKALCQGHPHPSSSPGQKARCQGHPHYLAKRLLAKGILITWPKGSPPRASSSAGSLQDPRSRSSSSWMRWRAWSASRQSADVYAGRQRSVASGHRVESRWRALSASSQKTVS